MGKTEAKLCCRSRITHIFRQNLLHNFGFKNLSDFDLCNVCRVFSHTNCNCNNTPYNFIYSHGKNRKIFRNLETKSQMILSIWSMVDQSMIFWSVINLGYWLKMKGKFVSFSLLRLPNFDWITFLRYYQYQIILRSCSGIGSVLFVLFVTCK